MASELSTPGFYARHLSTSQEVFVPESSDHPTSGHYWGPLPLTDFQPHVLYKLKLRA